MNLKVIAIVAGLAYGMFKASESLGDKITIDVAKVDAKLSEVTATTIPFVVYFDIRNSSTTTAHIKGLDGSVYYKKVKLADFDTDKFTIPAKDTAHIKVNARVTHSDVVSLIKDLSAGVKKPSITISGQIHTSLGSFQFEETLTPENLI